MAIMFDHEIVVQVPVVVRSIDMDGPDDTSDVLDALKGEIKSMTVSNHLEYEILTTTRDEY